MLLIDNYDSFVHNLARYFRRLGRETRVARNDELNASDIERLKPDAIVVSPGPKTPREAGCSLDVVRRLGATTPILGVCLGHQVIAEAMGGRIVRADVPMHGRTSLVEHDGEGVFEGVANPLTVCRYHSLMVDPASLPDCLRATAWTADGTIMALRHRELPIVGLQFHPESILTEAGYLLLAGFLRRAGLPVAGSAESLGLELTPPPPIDATSPTTPVTF